MVAPVAVVALLCACKQLQLLIKHKRNYNYSFIFHSVQFKCFFFYWRQISKSLVCRPQDGAECFKILFLRVKQNLLAMDVWFPPHMTSALCRSSFRDGFLMHFDSLITPGTTFFRRPWKLDWALPSSEYPSADRRISTLSFF
jgi:hypothetical protein